MVVYLPTTKSSCNYYFRFCSNNQFTNLNSLLLNLYLSENPKSSTFELNSTGNYVLNLNDTLNKNSLLSWTKINLFNIKHNLI